MSTPPDDAGYDRRYRNEFLMRGWAKWAVAAIAALGVAVGVSSLVSHQQRDEDARTACLERIAAGGSC